MKDFKKNNKRKSNADKIRKMRHSQRWKRTSERIRLKFHMQCMNPDGCELMAKEVHHWKPAVSYPQYFFEEWNLIPLCNQCHNKLGLLQGAKRDEYIQRWKQTLASYKGAD